MALCTFVIPTMGRGTLQRAIESLQAQNVDEWKAIVIYDRRYDVNYTSDDGRITVIKGDEQGHAGLIRNVGIKLVDTPWTAFLDDDDWLENTYMQKLRGYSISQPHLDIFVFTYHDAVNNNTVPNPRQKKIESCRVGISFAVKTDFIKEHNIEFTPYSVEDFRFLDDCVKAGAKYHLTHDLQYHVGGRGGWIRKD